jgi:hypothetical protein
VRHNLYIIHYLILMSVFLAGPAVTGQRTFKWIDEQGTIHYGDQVPPQYSSKERKVINQQGRIVKTYEAAKTPEQKAEEKRLAAIEAEKQRQREEQARYDRILLATYSNEKRMVMARDGKILSVKATIQLTQDRLKSIQRRLAEHTEEAAEYERSGKPIPVNLQNQIASIREQIAKNEAYIRDKQEEMVAIREKYDSDIRRFRELTSDEETPASDEQAAASATTAAPAITATTAAPAASATTTAPAVSAEQAAQTGPSSPSTRVAMKKPRVNPDIELTRHDRTLLATYPSEEAILRARDEDLAPVNFTLQQLGSQLDSLQLRLAQLSDNADEYERVDEILPDELVEEMKNVLAQISRNEELMEPKLAEKNEIEQKYADTLFRYRELTVY